MRKILALCLLTSALAACSFGGDSERDDIIIEMEQPPVHEEITTLDDMPEPPPMREEQAVFDQGRVEVFSLDGDAPELASRDDSEGIAVNKNISVFPLDDEGEDVPVVGQPFPERAGDNSTADMKAVHAPVTTIYFEHGSRNLSKADLDVIETVRRDFAARPNVILSVEGHASERAPETDPVSRKSVNLQMSLNRAQVVAEALMKEGVPEGNIRTVGWGEAHPKVPTNGKAAEELARRVEIIPVVSNK